LENNQFNFINFYKMDNKMKEDLNFKIKKRIIMVKMCLITIAFGSKVSKPVNCCFISFAIVNFHI